MTTLRRYRRSLPSVFFPNELGRLLDELLPDTDEETSAVWSPKMDVAETDTAYEVTVNLPGVPKDQIEVSYQNGQLTVSGERSEEKTEEKKNYLRIESSYGNFYRSVPLPNGVEDGEVEARFEDGVLKIEIPKAEESKPRQIKIS
jgi:HSP20 family protein